MFDGRLRVRRRGDGRLQYHEATAGTIWLCPAGIGEDMIHLYDDIEESLHMYLPASPLDGRGLEELGLDPGPGAPALRRRLPRSVHRADRPRRARRADARPDRSAASWSIPCRRRSASICCRTIRRWRRRRAALPAARGSLDRRRLARVIDFIEDNLGRDISLERVGARRLPQPLSLRPLVPRGGRPHAAPLSGRPARGAGAGHAARGRAVIGRGRRRLRLRLADPFHQRLQARNRHDARRLPDGRRLSIGTGKSNVRASRRPACPERRAKRASKGGLLSMRNILNCNTIPHPEEAAQRPSRRMAARHQLVPTGTSGAHSFSKLRRR